MMKKLAKIAAMILTAALLAGILSGCSGAGKTTEAPTTQAPATEAPTTAAPTTAAPTAEVPTTAAPTTAAPTTAAPTTAAPTTEAPATEAPATEAPATEPSSAEEKHFDEVPEGFKEFSYEGVTFLIPEDFTAQENGGMMLLMNEKQPTGDNINMAPSQDKLENYTEENLKKTMESVYQGTFNTEVKDFAYSREQIEGGEMVTVTFSAELYGIKMYITSCNLFYGGKAMNITFTQVTDEAADVFKTCIDSICITDLQ